MELIEEYLMLINQNKSSTNELVDTYLKSINKNERRVLSHSFIESYLSIPALTIHIEADISIISVTRTPIRPPVYMMGSIEPAMYNRSMPETTVDLEVMIPNVAVSRIVEEQLFLMTHAVFGWEFSMENELCHVNGRTEAIEQVGLNHFRFTVKAEEITAFKQREI